MMVNQLRKEMMHLQNFLNPDKFITFENGNDPKQLKGSVEK